ncbi:MAG: hypothetical protein ACOVP4_14035 [Bacteriovoracaceae bacterium]|jgi:hypothetical protein
MNAETFDSQPFFFFVTLGDKLPTAFFKLDAQLKKQGVILVPVAIDQLQVMVSSGAQNHYIAITSVSSFAEFKFYNEKVRHLLKFILRKSNISFFNMSSFQKLNDTNQFRMTKNFFFLKYPLNTETLGDKLVRYMELKSEKIARWPGGKRAGVKHLTV